MDQLNKKVVLYASAAGILAVVITATSARILDGHANIATAASLMVATFAVTMFFGSLPWRQEVTPSLLGFMSASAAGIAVLAASFDITAEPLFLGGAFVWGLGTCLAALFANLDDHVQPRLLVIVYSLEMLMVFFATKLLL